MANFDQAFAVIMGNEQGYANNPNDRGGETYAGISRKNWSNWEGWAYVDELKKVPNFPDNLSQNPTIQTCVKSFYKLNFWDILKLDSITPQPIATELFDLAVNCGIGVAGQFLQRSLNCLNNNGKEWPDLLVDGNIGAATLSAFAKANSYDVLKCVIALQGARYISICESNHSQEEFIKGWIRRAFREITAN